MKRTFPKIRRAFSTIEILIAIPIFALIMLALVVMMLSYYDIYNSQQASIDVEHDARTIMSEISKAALQADHVVASHTCASTLYTTNAHTVVFELPSVDSSGNIISGTYDYICIATTSASAYSYTVAGSGSARPTISRKISNNTLSSLTLTYDNADMTKVTNVDVDVVTAELVKQQLVQSHLHQQIYLRNI